MVCTCIYNVCTCIYHVCTWYNQLSQQVFEPGASWFRQVAFIAEQAASSCRHKWQQDVAYWGFGRWLSSQNGCQWGTAEEAYSFWAVIVQAHSGIQTCTYMFKTCSYDTHTSMFCPDLPKRSSKRLLLCCSCWIAGSNNPRCWAGIFFFP